MPTPPTRGELVNISRRLKIPLKHLLEYVRFMGGHPTTKLDPETRRYIRQRMSAPKFRAMEAAVDRPSREDAIARGKPKTNLE